MKPVKLVMSAFGPYLERTEIDFSRLGESGIYLITGDTGSGKTTIFEALSYALYGETVSGSDRSASMLRNKSADDTLETYVELDFIEKGKCYHIFRSPKYKLNKLKKSRKKSIASGEPEYETHESKLELNCISSGEVYTKEKEGTAKVESITGILKDNFKKICMIAQGDFMSVICEGTKERKRLLNDIFGTNKYEKLTETLKMYKSNAETKKNEILNEISTFLSLVSCNGESVYYKDAETRISLGINSAEDIDRIVEIITKIVDEDNESLRVLKEQILENEKEKDIVKKKLHTASIVQGYKKQLSEKNQTRLVLENELPILKEKHDKTKEYPEIASKYDIKAGIIRSKIEDYDRLDKLTSDLEKARAGFTECTSELEKIDYETKRLKNDIDESDKRLNDLDRVEAELQTQSNLYDNVVERGKELRRLQEEYKESNKLKQLFETAKDDYAASKNEYKRQEEIYEEIYLRFLDDQAGFLSQSLEAGKPCPVCGSVHHPNPAVCRNDAPSRDDVDSAKKRKEKLNEKMKSDNVECVKSKTEYDNSVDSVKKNAKRLLDIDDYNEIGTYIEEKINEYLEKAKELKRKKEKCSKELDEKNKIKKRLGDMRKKSDELHEKEVLLTGEKNTFSEKVSAYSGQLEELRKNLEFNSKAEAQKNINELIKRSQDLRKKYEETEQAIKDQNIEIEKLKSEEKILKEQIADNENFDITLLNEQYSRLEEVYNKLDKEKTIISTRTKSNMNAAENLVSKRDSCQKAIEFYINCKELSDVANGKIGFDTYALVSCFDRILLRANNRMKKMTEGRYRLIRSEYADDGRKSYGLDINAFDNTSGTTRRVSTLSGGEKFMAALALALGLSDEIQSRSGGVHLDTMFIDEGFGSLSEDNLVRAVQTLKELSTEDCLIGIISHVGKLKEMIDKRISIKCENNITTAKVEI